MAIRIRSIRSEVGVEWALDSIDCVVRSFARISVRSTREVFRKLVYLAFQAPGQCRAKPVIRSARSEHAPGRRRPTSFTAVSSSILRWRSSKIPFCIILSGFAAMMLTLARRCFTKDRIRAATLKSRSGSTNPDLTARKQRLDPRTTILDTTTIYEPIILVLKVMWYYIFSLPCIPARCDMLRRYLAYLNNLRKSVT